MEIRSKYEDSIIQFELVNAKKGSPTFITVKIKVIVPFGSAEDELQFELSDFEEALENLNRLNDKLKFGFFLQHIDERFELKFTPKNDGDIEVLGFFKSKNYKDKLSFSFELYPVTLITIIQQLDEFLKEAKSI